MNCPMMVSLGVYLLGAADADERRRIEAHLPDCRDCQAELIWLAPVPGLLADIPAATGQHSHPEPPEPAERPASRPRRSRIRRRRAILPLAACLAALGLGAGLWLSSGASAGQAGAGQQSAGQAGAGQAGTVTLTGTNHVTHVSATVTLTATSWGSSVQLWVDGLPENVDCRLIVRSREGHTEVSGVWDAWQKGPVSIPASISWLPADVASVQVATTTTTLITIPGR